MPDLAHPPSAPATTVATPRSPDRSPPPATTGTDPASYRAALADARARVFAAGAAFEVALDIHVSVYELGLLDAELAHATAAHRAARAACAQDGQPPRTQPNAHRQVTGFAMKP